MLDISRISSGKLDMNLKPIDLSELVKEIFHRFAAQLASAGIEVVFDLAPDVVGRWDGDRLEQVFTNLIINGMRYAPARPFHVTLQTTGREALFRMRDHGPGIPPERQDRIFNRFERFVSASEVSGLGLGLYISKQIVEAHQGSIRVESLPGAGAEFVVTLPMQQN